MTRRSLRKTKIVCTLGPAVDNEKGVEELLKAGMNVARFNFSHGNHEEHLERIRRLRKVSDRIGIPCATLLDTKGPEIRTGVIAGDRKIDLAIGRKIVLSGEQFEGDGTRVSVSYRKLPEEVKPGGHIYVADGLIDLEVERVEGPEIYCVVRSGGTLGSRKNVNVPGVRTSLPAVTEKDESDIAFGVSVGVDYIAASFIRKPGDVRLIREIVESHGALIPIIAKIEDQEGLDNIDEIIRIAGGVMVARGDLGVQLSIEDIPLAQKRIIEKCNRENKPVITATQMLDSMIHNPSPTRAELTDVANAIFDGTDAVMLSGETASGKYPTKTVEMMNRIALTVESSPEYLERNKAYFSFHGSSGDIGHAVAKAAYVVADEIDAKAIVAPTLRGNTPRIISKFRPKQAIIAVTASEQSARELLLNWGIFPVMTELVKDSEQMIQNALRLAMKYGYAEKFDKVVSTAGIPIRSAIPVNTIKVHFLGNILGRSRQGIGGSVSGRVVKGVTLEEALAKAKGDKSEILIVREFDTSFLDLARNLAGVISEEPSEVAPEEIEKANPEIVLLADLAHATDIFEDKQFVTLSGQEKLVYEGMIDEE